MVFQHSWLTLSSHELYLMHLKSIILRRVHYIKTAKSPWLNGILKCVWSNVNTGQTRKLRPEWGGDSLVLSPTTPLSQRVLTGQLCLWGQATANRSFRKREWIWSHAQKPLHLERLSVKGSPRQEAQGGSTHITFQDFKTSALEPAQGCTGSCTHMHPRMHTHTHTRSTCHHTGSNRRLNRPSQAAVGRAQGRWAKQ